MCDWIDNAVALQMGRSEGQIYGYLHLPCRVQVNSRIRGEWREPPSGPDPASLLEKPIG